MTIHALILAASLGVPLQIEPPKPLPLRPGAPIGYVYSSYDWYMGGSGWTLWTDGHYRDGNGKRVD